MIKDNTFSRDAAGEVSLCRPRHAWQTGGPWGTVSGLVGRTMFAPLSSVPESHGDNACVWIEMFNFKAVPDSIAQNSIRYLKEQAEMARQ